MSLSVIWVGLMEMLLVSLSGARGERRVVRGGRRGGGGGRGIPDITSLQLSLVIDSVRLRTEIILAAVFKPHD